MLNFKFITMPINKEKLQAREVARVSRPEFIRPESWRYTRLETGGENQKEWIIIRENRKVVVVQD